MRRSPITSRQFSDAFPDLQYEHIDQHEAGNVAVDEGYITGTHTAPLASHLVRHSPNGQADQGYETATSRPLKGTHDEPQFLLRPDGISRATWSAPGDAHITARPWVGRLPPTSTPQPRHPEHHTVSSAPRCTGQRSAERDEDHPRGTPRRPAQRSERVVACFPVRWPASDRWVSRGLPCRRLGGVLFWKLDPPRGDNR